MGFDSGSRRGAQPVRADEANIALCLARLFLPPDSDGTVRTADLSPENRAFLGALYPGAPLAPMAKAALLARLEARHRAALLDAAVYGLARAAPHFSAHRVLTGPQRGLLSALLCIGAWAFCAAPIASLRLCDLLLSLGALAAALFRGVLALPAPLRRTVPPAPLDDTLPVYSILVPLYREAAALPGLARALRALAYPRARLDIKLVVEADDDETANAARALGAPFEVIAVPPGGPRTKPKACNYALPFARGELLVIYDAEDRPEPDQLLKAVAAFRAAPRRIACLQARLAIHNAAANWLTRMYALDYALWFGVMLPALERLGVPMPLGGTSNHFRLSVLRALGGWDAFNVTEDADLGIRLAQKGLGVAMLDSTTFEECPARLGPWLRQRSRWQKGYMQTWLVHMRDPRRLLGRSGLCGFLAFQLFLGGGVIFALATPLLWCLSFWPGLLQGWAGGLAPLPGGGLIAAYLVLTGLAVAGQHGRRELSLYGLTMVAYWALISVAAYRALWQLIRRPFHWEKTPHGAGPQ